MGYHVSILRTEDKVQRNIEISEIHRAISSEWKFDTKHKCFEKIGKDNEICVLWYSNGELWAKNPSQWAITQMLDLADSLGARVRGDEFETYISNNNTYLHPDDISLIKKANKAGEDLIKESLSEQKTIRGVFIGFFLLMGAIAFVIGKNFE
ncbi:hypothetical protein [Microbulbifer sp. THAF38]|uniref:hypothetical protein n=1 Tax=Microbulbifer sp. THAF38 TaxID=2587856 RepID=UPI00126888B1|nr:hypothetical protein [Microbulbifer sp. THAF38]QFT54457.1 hypothetical protein FIU95_07810 [Microbulbifer sp. THAF38]